MRVHVVHAHPVESSFNRALFHTVTETLAAAGHEVDALNLYDDGFDAVLSREERLNYHEIPGNLTQAVAPYVDRLRQAEGIVYVFPVWNYGFPAILKGYFDRVFLPGVSFRMSEGGDRGKLEPALTNIRKAAYVTTYGGTRFRTMLMGDPPRKVATRWGWATYRTPNAPEYLALYDMNNQSPEKLAAFCDRVKRSMQRF